MEKNKRVILAFGEVTGHAHVIEEGAIRLAGKEIATKIKTDKGAKTRHEEHHVVITPGGIGDVAIVREYNPLTEKIKKVVD